MAKLAHKTICNLGLHAPPLSHGQSRLENRSSPNPSRARARCHGRARHILAHTLPQTLSRCDLSLPSSRRHIDPAAIAWSQPRRACATPNMPVPSPCSSLDNAIFGIVIFAASWTLGVRFQWLGVPKVPLTLLVYTRCNYRTVGLAVRAARCQHGRESLRRFWFLLWSAGPRPRITQSASIRSLVCS